MAMRKETYFEARQKFSDANRMLTGAPQNDREQFSEAWGAGEQKIRAYHDQEHFFDIAGRGQLETTMDAVRFRAGINHDVVYQHVDAKGQRQTGFAPGVEEKISKYITRQNGAISLSKNPELANDTMFQATLQIFNIDEAKRVGDGVTLSPFAGQNELLSTLYAVEQAKELGIPEKYVIAEIAHIQGTVPFGAAGHFDELQKRLEKVNGQLADQLTQQELASAIQSSVRMANVDVASFTKEFPDFIKDSRALLVENVAANPENLDKPAFMLTASMGPVGFLEGLVASNSPSGKMRVFHGVAGEPGDAKLAADEAKALDNIKTMAEYFRSNAAAVAMVTAISVANTPAGSTPSTDISLTDALHRDFKLTPAAKGELTENGAVALKEAQSGSNPLMTDQVAAYLLETLGSDGIKQLAKLANDTGINPAAAAPPFSPNPKPGMNTPELASEFLAKAQAIFQDKGVNFADVKQDLERAMQAKELPYKLPEHYAPRVELAKDKLKNLLTSDDWKKGSWAKGTSA